MHIHIRRPSQFQSQFEIIQIQIHQARNMSPFEVFHLFNRIRNNKIVRSFACWRSTPLRSYFIHQEGRSQFKSRIINGTDKITSRQIVKLIHQSAILERIHNLALAQSQFKPVHNRRNFRLMFDRLTRIPAHNLFEKVRIGFQFINKLLFIFIYIPLPCQRPSVRPYELPNLPEFWNDFPNRPRINLRHLSFISFFGQPSRNFLQLLFNINRNNSHLALSISFHKSDTRNFRTLRRLLNER